MIGTLGGQELILILIIALIVFGPRKLPDIGKSVGKMLVEFRRASTDFKRTIENEVDADKLRERTRFDTPATPAAPRHEPEKPAVEPDDADGDAAEPARDESEDATEPARDESEDAAPTGSVPREASDPEAAAPAASDPGPDRETAVAEAEIPTAPAGEPTR